MLALGLDTATPAVTVALVDDDRVLAERATVDARRHGELLGPAVAAVLAGGGRTARDLDVIGVGVGPGPYTGLRVGIVTALALGDAVGVPVHGLCTLDVLAAEAGTGQAVTVVTDARRREVFWATYDAAGDRISGPAVGRPADAAALVTGRVVGAGAALYVDAFGTAGAPAEPSAAVLCRLLIARLADGGELLPPLPLYLRRPDAVPPAAPKPVTTR